MAPPIVGVVTGGTGDSQVIVRGVVQGEGEGFSQLDIWVPDSKTGAGTVLRNVPRREQSDWEDDNGRTWHTVSADD